MALQKGACVQIHVVVAKKDLSHVVRHARCHGLRAGPVSDTPDIGPWYEVEVVPVDVARLQGMYKVYVVYSSTCNGVSRCAFWLSGVAFMVKALVLALIL